jgi:hypothetical protein
LKRNACLYYAGSNWGKGVCQLVSFLFYINIFFGNMKKPFYFHYLKNYVALDELYFFTTPSPINTIHFPLKYYY